MANRYLAATALLCYLMVAGLNSCTCATIDIQVIGQEEDSSVLLTTVSVTMDSSSIFSSIETEKTISVDDNAEITYIKVIGNNPKGKNAEVKLINGGSSLSFATLRFKGKKKQSINSSVEVYGKPK